MQTTQHKTSKNVNMTLVIAWVLLFAFMAIALLFFCNDAIGSSAVPEGSILL